MREILSCMAICEDVRLLYCENTYKWVSKDISADSLNYLSLIIRYEVKVVTLDKASCYTTNPYEDEKLLPPHSPFLNPIKNLFNISKMRSNQRQHYTDNSYDPKTSYVEKLLEPRKLSQYIMNNCRHSTRHHNRCLDKGDIWH